MKVNLIVLSVNPTEVQWDLGSVYTVGGTPKEINNVLTAYQKDPSVDYWLIWDGQLGNPDTNKIMEIISKPGDVWHAGLNLGMRGKPDILNFVCPSWPLIIDPDSNIESSSWRLSLRCCLFKADVLRQMGGPSELFDTLDAASLELGYRYIKGGVFTRFIPEMCKTGNTPDVELSIYDQFKILCLYYPIKWRLWTLFRCLVIGKIQINEGIKRLVDMAVGSHATPALIYQHLDPRSRGDFSNADVTVLIPTLCRYPYINSLIDQLGKQTIKPKEVIIIDQTPVSEREQINTQRSQLNFKIFYLDPPGQCSARNLGLISAQSDYILFLDDDIEITDNLIELHLQNMAAFGVNISCGVVTEDAAAMLPKDFSFIRISDVFTTCNSMIKKSVLQDSGLFDLAFDRKTNEDGDLFMRFFLNGQLMVLNPTVKLIHFHAPRGGLRTHGQRKITYTSSRKSLIERRLLNEAEFYIQRRYFNESQRREARSMSTLGTFSIHGGIFIKILKWIISFFMLPFTLKSLNNADRNAEKMLANGFPKIPHLETGE